MCAYKCSDMSSMVAYNRCDKYQTNIFKVAKRTRFSLRWPFFNTHYMDHYMVLIPYGPGPDKTGLLGFRQSETKISLLSNRDQL